MKLLLPKNLFELIRDRLIAGTDPRYVYHNWGHTERVISYVEKFALQCNKSPDEIRLLQTAALLHDYGYLVQYDQNEKIAAEYAVGLLPEYGYTKEETEAISRMIISTIPGTYPEYELDQILCDADICHVGTEAFYESGMCFRKELNLVKGLVYTNREWDELELNFLLDHKFKHPGVGAILQSGKEKNILKMRDLLSSES
ncbi:MAG: HD domain-containing protein [Lentisphaerae bacterium]|nr:HD domain-containing protein [Lentisphaerota bacterium]